MTAGWLMRRRTCSQSGAVRHDRGSPTYKILTAFHEPLATSTFQKTCEVASGSRGRLSIVLAGLENVEVADRRGPAGRIEPRQRLLERCHLLGSQGRKSVCARRRQR